MRLKPKSTIAPSFVTEKTYFVMRPISDDALKCFLQTPQKINIQIELARLVKYHVLFNQVSPEELGFFSCL